MQPTKGAHSPWKIALVIAQALFFALVILFNYLSSTEVGKKSGLYQSSTGDVADKYSTLITPSGWTFTIWAFIYIWQLVHVLYCFSLLCRRNNEGEYLYAKPGHIHFSFYIVYILNNLFNIAWILVFDRELLVTSAIVLFMIAITLYICGYILCKYLDRSANSLVTSGNRKDIWMTRLFTLNGIAMYGTWTTIASLLNLATALQYRANVDAVACAWMCLGVLTAELALWFVLETFILDRFLRYCFTPYIVLIVAFSGVLSKHFNPENPTSYIIYATVLLGISVVLGIAKVIIMFVRGSRSPINYTTFA